MRRSCLCGRRAVAILPPTDSPGNSELLTLVAAGCSLVALIRIAQLCRAAAEALDRGRGLPAARVIGAS